MEQSFSTVSRAEIEQKSKEKKNTTFEKPFVCLIDIEDLDEKMLEEINRIKTNGEFVNFSGGQDHVLRYNMLNQGRGTYMLSNVNENDKYSEAFFNCTGLIGMGIDKETGEHISFLSHQNPDVFLEKGREDFVSDLKHTLKNFKNKINPESFYIAGFGGQYEEDYQIQYLQSVKLLSQVVKGTLGEELSFVTGPNTTFTKIEGGGTRMKPTAIYVDTKQNRIYLVRPHQNNNDANHPFSKQTMLEQDLKWRRE